VEQQLLPGLPVQVLPVHGLPVVEPVLPLLLARQAQIMQAEPEALLEPGPELLSFQEVMEAHHLMALVVLRIGPAVVVALVDREEMAHLPLQHVLLLRERVAQVLFREVMDLLLRVAALLVLMLPE
jgi:hypothetical protein